MVPLQEEFGWSRATISAAVAINLVVFGLSGPFSAALVERVGLRRVVTVALALIAASAGLTVFVSQPWQLYLLWGARHRRRDGRGRPGAGRDDRHALVPRAARPCVGLLRRRTRPVQLIFLPLMSHSRCRAGGG